MINFSEMELRDKRALLDELDTFIFDCDGVLWTGETAIAGAVEIVNKLQMCGKRVVFLTNNSTKTKEEYCEKFAKLGFRFEPDHIFTTSVLVTKHLKEHLPEGKSVYVVGTPGLARQLSREGIPNSGSGPDPCENLSDVNLDPNVGAVVVGFDLDINYVKMTKACSYLRNPECLFVASNKDSVFPSIISKLVCPGSGAIVRAIEFASERDAYVVGKPNPLIFEGVKESMNIKAEKTMMIGDNLFTDITFGLKCGYKTLLVLTGVCSLEMARNIRLRSDLNPSPVPEYYTGSVTDLNIF